MFKTADTGVHTALHYRDPPIPDHCHHVRLSSARPNFKLNRRGVLR